MPIPPRPGPRPSLAASASREEATEGPLLGALGRLAHARGPGGRTLWPRLTCCCSTSQPTTSISKARSGCKSFIRDYPHTILLISHDRDLLNEAVSSILHLDRGKLIFYQGNYDSFERQRREKQALTVKLKKKQEDQRKHMMAFVERFRYKASKARQAQSRLKALSKLEPIAEIVEDRVAPFFFPNPEKAIAPPLVTMGQGQCRLCRRTSPC